MNKAMAIKEGKTYTHIDKLYWPDDGYTKRNMLEYYERIAPYLLPHIKNRPMALKRYPEGVEGFSFFQKNIEGNVPKFLKIASIPAKTVKKNVHYAVCNNVQSLLYLANLGTIELHPWSSRLGRLDTPDYMIFDLDPGPRASFGAVIRVAREIHAVLDGMKIPSACKTSGKRGLHIYASIKPRQPYEKVRARAKTIAMEVLRKIPDIASLEHWPAKRKDKVYIDISRNAIGQTVVAPYSLRAVPGAPVSTPLEWSEVKSGLNPKKFTIKTIFRRLAVKRNLWVT